MLPGGAQKVDSSTSELFSSLKLYLNNKDRIQPFIGLSSIIECVKTGACKMQIFYLCEVCLCRLSKADMRHHIIGSLHRYNYIKTWHPHFVSEWEGNPTLSKLAWPLMEIAKKIEEKEGTGYIQVLEFEEDLYKTLEIQSDDKAITLINSLRWRSEPDSDCDQLENNSTPQQGTVLFSKSPQTQPERLTDDLKFFNTHRLYQASAENNSPLTQEAVYAPFMQQYWSQSRNESQNIQTSPEPSENSHFLDDYTGPKPLIGLVNMVECRSEDGYTYCFLCHCCRVRSNKYDIIDHLTCSSHLFNILMETHPEQVELSADINHNSQLLQSLAMEVENSEGRGELKVLKVPHSLGSVMTGRSYHWWLSAIQNCDAGFPGKQEPVQSKVKRKKKKSKVSDTVFKVTLPLVQGSLMVRRTSFSGDNRQVSPTYWPPADEGLHASPESEDFQLDCYSNSVGFNYTENTLMDANSQFQPNDFRGANQDIEQKVDGCFTDTDDPTEDLKVTVYEERNAGIQSCSSTYEVGHNAAQEKQNDETSHKQVWPSSNFYQCGGGYTNHWYRSPHHNEGGAISKIETRLETARPHHQQFQNQDMFQDHPSQFTASMGHHFMSGGLAPNFDADMMKTYPHSGHVGHPSAHYGSVTPEQAQFSHIDQTPLHTYGYMGLCFGDSQTRSMAYQHVTYDPNPNTQNGTPPSDSAVLDGRQFSHSAHSGL